ncbi:MAG: hypothetical protein JKX74_01775, partial [Flavobacteriales bacterium]|nr:hypothetical protein [Flavobacteriales bacterium]
MKHFFQILLSTIILFHAITVSALAESAPNRLDSIEVGAIVPLPLGVIPHNLGTIDGKLFLLGGRDFNGEVSDRCYVQSDDEEWASFHLEHPLLLAGMVELDESVYLIGGYSGRELSSRV